MYSVQSYHIAQSVNIKAVRNKFKATLLFGDSDELFYKLNEEQYFYVFQFGIVSFFNVKASEVEEIIGQISPFGKENVSDSLSEDISVNISEKIVKVNFDSVTIPSFDEEMIRLIMLHTSQSVALDRYAEVTGLMLEEASVHTKTLEDKGRIYISKKKLKMLIGRIMNVKNGIYENMYIFDSPDLTWQDERLAKLDNDLKLTFDLKNRYRNIQDSIAITKENLELFKDIWDHKESSTLEWIIIILIFVEIIDLFVTKIL
ncbi:RMD1 family protein [Ulvibacter antarcticus]|uniref:Putative Rmd1/YagE family protein n=1 Tax=Ulvibacter antarcticus TaxID=442714 RepID=A0A3L9Z7M2_9FLAO|nr:RMD1 family protein [Ulvibacter antarcticus]RMA66448.1 putative Rmd1/YagE family protein [Ulvibacter antarcticus]